MSKMSAHINVGLFELYESLITLLEPASKSNKMRNELLDLLIELKGETLEDSHSPQKKERIKDGSDRQSKEFHENSTALSQDPDQTESDNFSESNSLKFSKEKSQQKNSAEASLYAQEP